jgi:hypothetical protein
MVIKLVFILTIGYTIRCPIRIPTTGTGVLTLLFTDKSGYRNRGNSKTRCPYFTGYDIINEITEPTLAAGFVRK